MNLQTLSDDEIRHIVLTENGEVLDAVKVEIMRRFLKGAHSVTGSYRDGYEAGFDDAEDGFPNRFS